jgi:NAD(P)-dependent dehydrogenase (short-subunit alcohol dehydrogenase family)
MLMQDRVVIVAGVGPGMGRSIALASAREGADVVLALRPGSTRWPRRSPRSDGAPCPCRAT